ncbi:MULTISPECIES: bifunctional 3-(3-hydroxy-phenyl)propionate/3-hydroxycinnamic acid hydroxylase [Pseudomonas]|uniref:bifunctional 3-(3-hydroxy-phenyl)propionate/3-hydroxycinnamic acid hydroxylase n=1 Tax=Pseudomonas TaxID=286 RepID=UPI0015A3106E|nr:MULTISPECIES: bifunctional 3-(3-hydroxy-phenyl)propionate/3-hydroxycinnamic acid hydroxylase [Pseudomonas]NVZ66286.1 bifunctional 3-(3-hydroxy-phenyl)propionate/3-hydroxycinnamic acid hydroxylase [Pseudomonas gingeri]NVZ75126.1 bifunctional 3-(3-hydroxy-phenyl)propionate/3-hydroxycinnamic acid hydroxylase [Pseudomonas gingeri]NWA06000.1 bifunctional 3-(3-hydroxy-phenyl)propionate/3-hydroxycinnamic acid hydroxylase [Pseudomonas gingeri]BBP76187.1 3-(3-hydroxy-phenyl)propionate/3-hydroxycinnam
MTTSNIINTGVLISGAGPTGLTLANYLGQAGVETFIVDRKQSTVGEPRAVSIDDESLRTMQAVGMDQAVLKDVVPGYGVHYYTRPGGRCFGKVEPTSTLYGFPKRNAFRQPLFEATLHEGMQRFDNLRVGFAHELLHVEQDATGVTASVRNADGDILIVRARYLVACDGGRSPVRKQLGINLVGSSFQSRWLVVDTDQDDDPFWQCRMYCDARRPTVDVPGPHRTRRYEFMLKADESDEEMLDEARIKELVKPFRGDKPISIVRKTVYTFHARVAERWREGRIFLAGDAAHLTPPYAGQGMNSGVRDAHNLGWKLAGVFKGQLSSTALDSYETERRDHAWALIKLALGLGVVMAPSTVWRANLISGAFRVIGLLPPLRDYFLQMRFKPKPRFTQGLVIGNGRCGQLSCGQMFPQPRVEDAAGNSVLLDKVLGTGFALLQYASSVDSRLDALRHPLWERLEARRILVLPKGGKPDPAHTGPVWIDSDGALQALLDEPSGQLLLLRPDRYVAAIFPLAEEQDIAEGFAALLGVQQTPASALVDALPLDESLLRNSR